MLCHIIVQFDVNSMFIYIIMSLLIIVISLIVNLAFVGPKLLIIFNIDVRNSFSVIVVSNDNNNQVSSSFNNYSID